MKRIKLLACSAGVAGLLLVTGCESSQSTAQVSSKARVFSPGHMQGYQSAGQSSTQSHIFSPGHMQGYYAPQSSNSTFPSNLENWPSHITGY